MSTASPWKSNPYVIGTPIADRQLFFGREVLLQFIDDNLRQGTKIILLYGQRRIGKSSVLAQIPAFIDSDRFYCVSFDLQNQGNRPLGQVLHALATAIVEQLEEDSPLNPIPIPSAADLITTPTRFSQEFLPQVMTHLAPKRLVWLLDEFDVLADDPSEAAIDHFLPYLEALLASYPRLHLIPTVGRRPEELPTLLRFFKSAPAQEVGLLDETSAIQLITRPAIGVLEYEPAAIPAILRLTAGHPYFTQVVCFNLFGQARQHDRWTVTAADVAHVISRAIDSSRPGLTWFRDSLPIPERVMFSAVAESQEPALNSSSVPLPLRRLKACGIVPTPTLQRSIDQLVEWGFLEVIVADRADSTVAYYRVKIEFVRQWLVVSYPLMKAAWELERLSPEAQRWYDAGVQQQQAGDLPTALQSYQQALHFNPNHFSTVLAAAELYLESQHWTEAVSLYQRIFKLEPVRSQEGLIRSLVGYGQALMQQGNVNLARTQFLQVLDIEPQHSLAQHWLQAAETQISQTFLAAANPFTVGQPAPIDRFIGRQAELATAIEQIDRGGHVAIWGGAGIGKTSFLHQLACPLRWQPPGENAHPVMVLVSCRSIMPTFTAQGFWLDVFEGLRDRLAASPELNSSISPISQQVEECLQQQTASVSKLRSIAQQLARHGKKLVLLIDDYDIALQPNPDYREADIDRFLRELAATEISSTIAIVVASSRRLDELRPNQSFPASPFSHYLFLPLPPLSGSEAQALLSWVAIDPALQRGILALADGNPTLLQLAGALLYTELRRGQIPSLRQFVPAFQRQAAPFFQSIWARLNSEEQGLLLLMALEPETRADSARSPSTPSQIAAILSQHEPDLMRLEDQGLLRQTTTPTSFTIAASALEGWLIQRLQSSRPEEQPQTLLLKLATPTPVRLSVSTVRLDGTAPGEANPQPSFDKAHEPPPPNPRLPSFTHWMHRFIQRSIDNAAIDNGP